MRYPLSFGTIEIITHNIAEVIVNEGVVMTLEIVQEYDNFLQQHFTQPFGLIINRINHYTYTFETKLHISSLENLKAGAIITYHVEGKKAINDILQLRSHDNLNAKFFDGMDLGRKKAINWLMQELPLFSNVTQAGLQEEQRNYS
ncbi:hypothetical protein [Thalassotalea aquiviva]|uniref:hypothetical protein n=1 Tax=Thalassotalea aquiviva TaxID=3242415 RepID=UPI00352B17A0